MLYPSAQLRGQFYFVKVIALISEFFVVHQSCKLAYYLRYNTFGPVEEFYFSFFLIFALGWIGISLSSDSYDPTNLENLQLLARNFLATTTLHVFLILFYIVSVKAQYLSRYYLILTYTTTLLSVISFRALLFIGYKFFMAINYTTRQIVLVGADPIMHQLKEFLTEQQTDVLHLLSEEEDIEEVNSKARISRAVSKIKRLHQKKKISELYFSVSLANENLIDDLTDFTDDNFIYFRMVTDLNPLRRRNFSIDFVGPYPTLSIRQEPLKSLGAMILKRAFDIIFSLVVILLVFPIIFPIVAIAILMESEGPVFIRQLRTGRNAQNFTIFKFRTMYTETESEEQAVKGDKRITKVGRFLRRTSLDELPQFINVLLGDMSVVGPRPHMVSHTHEYTAKINKYLLRHFVLPGITGHAQVNGFRGGTEDPALMEERVKYDAWYIENWSMLLDIKIILQTIWLVFKGQENAY
ncbi:MAG: exopolysaccharide biosynthesis polyprenyl glycosylphosphotransferase [Bacteroidia bacterium]|nr:exopolysaccharide biosynthesis polyprenyl glycosylphosphotransferase [Bacteroidia bacterium]